MHNVIKDELFLLKDCLLIGVSMILITKIVGKQKKKESLVEINAWKIFEILINF